jgi:hypothetical protein
VHVWIYGQRCSSNLYTVGGGSTQYTYRMRCGYSTAGRPAGRGIRFMSRLPARAFDLPSTDRSTARGGRIDTRRRRPSSFDNLPPLSSARPKVNRLLEGPRIWIDDRAEIKLIYTYTRPASSKQLQLKIPFRSEMLSGHLIPTVAKIDILMTAGDVRRKRWKGGQLVPPAAGRGGRCARRNLRHVDWCERKKAAAFSPRRRGRRNSTGGLRLPR